MTMTNECYADYQCCGDPPVKCLAHHSCGDQSESMISDVRNWDGTLKEVSVLLHNSKAGAFSYQE